MHRRERHSFGSKPSFRRFLHEARLSKEIVKGHIAWETKNRTSDGVPWKLFRKQMEECLETLDRPGKFPGSLAKITKKINSTHKNGEQITILDLTGESDAGSIGANTTISVALPAGSDRELGKEVADSIKRIERSPKHVILRGNILSHRGLEQLQTELGAHERPLFVFFLPGAGAEKHSGNPYSYRRMSRVLATAYRALVDDGEMYIDLAFLDGVLSEVDMRDALDAPDAIVEKGVGKNTFHITKVIPVNS